MNLSIFDCENFLLFLMFLLEGKELVNFKLSPNKIDFITKLVKNLPPRSSSYNSANQHWVVSLTNKNFIISFHFILHFHIEAVGEIDFPQKILINLKFDFVEGLYIGFAGGLAHPKNKILFFVWGLPLQKNIFFDFVLLSKGEFRCKNSWHWLLLWSFSW